MAFSSVKDQSTTLLWKSTNDAMDKISLKSSGALMIHYPGYYLIQSQVTFSKADQKAVLKQTIWTQKSKTEDPVQLLTSCCSLPRDSAVPEMCTSSQTGVFRLEKDQMVFVNVTDISLVNSDLTTFGLFRLQAWMQTDQDLKGSTSTEQSGYLNEFIWQGRTMHRSDYLILLPKKKTKPKSRLERPPENKNLPLTTMQTLRKI